MSFVPIFRHRARADADRIYQWIAARSPAGAMRWYAALNEAITEICDHPLLFALAAESRIVHEPVREKLFKTPRGRRYRIVFRVLGDQVHILRVRGPGQAPVRRRDLGP